MNTQLLDSLTQGLYYVTLSSRHSTAQPTEVTSTVLSATGDADHIPSNKVSHAVSEAKLWPLRMGHLPFSQLHHAHPNLTNNCWLSDIC